MKKLILTLGMLVFLTSCRPAYTHEVRFKNGDTIYVPSMGKVDINEGMITIKPYSAGVRYISFDQNDVSVIVEHYFEDKLVDPHNYSYFNNFNYVYATPASEGMSK